MERICEFCGKRFIQTGKREMKFCRKECARKYHTRKNTEECRPYVAPEKQKHKPKKGNSITEIASRAKAAGMTYGQYVAAMKL